MEIATHRLLLRPYRADDWEAVHAFRGDAEALKYEPWGPDSAAHVQRELADASKVQAKELAGEQERAITLKSSGQVVGGCRVILPIPSLGRWGWATVGYVVQRRFWGMGYATETLQALIDHARKQPLVIGVNAISDSHNLASIKVLEKCRLNCVGMIAETEAVKGRFRDMLKYELVFKRW
jgi:[ribosomal protein S5]-alanine N-acetyltransferase